MRTKLRSKVSLLLLAFAIMLAVPATALALSLDSTSSTSLSPTIQSDKDDYAPGSTVTLTGVNWQPGESVHINVNDDQAQTWSRDVDVTADASGSITDQFQLPSSFVAVYKVTATGAQSGVATTTFTDGNFTIGIASTGTVTPTSWTVSYNTYGKGSAPDTTCSGTVQNSGSLSGGGNIAIGQNESAKVTGVTVSSEAAFDYWSSSPTSTTPVTPGCVAGGSGTVGALYAHFKTAKLATGISQVSGSGTYGGNATLTAKLTQGSNNLAGKSIDFKLDGNSVGSATTDSSGVATLNSVSLGTKGAGSYPGAVSANFAGDSGYLASSGSGALTVNKAQATLTLNGLGGHTYNGSPQGATVATSPTGISGVSITYNGSTTQPTNAGSYNVVASLNNPNYQATDATGTMVIAKADPQIVWSNPADITYGTLLSGTQLNATAKGVDGNSLVGSFSYDPASGTKLDAGDNQNLKANFTPTDTGNYNNASKTVQINVKKADQTITFGALADKTYGDADFALSASSDSGLDVSFASTTPAKCSVNNGSVSILEAGTCTIEASQSGNSNYNAATSVSRSFEIAKKAASVTLSNLSQTYDGTVKSVSATTDPANLHVDFTYSQNGNTATPKNAGSYTVEAKVNEANYEGSATDTLVINKAHATINLSNLSATYNGSPQGVSVSTTPDVPSGQLTVTYNGSQTKPTNAGSYNVVASLNDANYEATDATATFVIEKAVAQVNLSGLSKTYNGSPQGVAVSTTPAGLNVDLTYDGNAQAPTNAGSYAVAAVVNEANYKGNASDTLVIGKATPQVLINWSNSTYNGTPNPASATVSGVGFPAENLGAADSLAYYSGSTASGTALPGAPTNAGIYTVKATFNGAPNYNQASAFKTITIAKANPQITWSNPAAIDYGTALSAAQLNAQADVAGTFQYTPAAGTILKAGTQTLKADFTPADSGNYNAAQKTVQIVVNPYYFTGFFQPIDNSGIFNSAKAGSTIPVKFSLGGDKGMDVLAQTPTATKVSCDPSATIDAIEETTSATSGLKYDPVANQYIYNWKTATSYAGTCQRLTVTLADGATVKTALFKFTK